MAEDGRAYFSINHVQGVEAGQTSAEGGWHHGGHGGAGASYEWARRDWRDLRGRMG